jgi:probable phosphoglycerate mutase
MPGDPVEYLPYRLHRIECIENELALGELNMEL